MTYIPASMTPGTIAAAYSLTTERLAMAPYTISMIDGGIRMPRQPPAQTTPAASRVS